MKPYISALQIRLDHHHPFDWNTANTLSGHYTWFEGNMLL